MRGKVATAAPILLGSGITPAYAGKRQSFVPCFRSHRDHPRLCGEKELLGLEFDTIMGSPPPMRGKAQRAFHGIMTIRITPAYAGKRCMRLGVLI